MTGERKTLTRVQAAIDRGATTVEETHKSIANLPLKVLEGSDILRRPAREVRRLQDQSIGAIYGLIRKINRQAATLASELLDRLGKRNGVRTEAGSKHAATSQPAPR
jgi:hypothetical protein